MSSQAREGLYATLYLSDDVAAITTANTVALLTGVDLSWAQAKRRFFQLGSIVPSAVLDGIITYDGAFRRAYFTNKYIGSVNIGTCNFIGSICPRGTAQPAMMGSVKITSGNLRNMSAESADAVTEEQTFVFYNVTFFG